MISILFYLLIVIIILIGIYVTVMRLTNTAKEEMKRNWEAKNSKFNLWEKDLESQYSKLESEAKEFEHYKKACAYDISRKRSAAQEEYEKALNAMKVSEKIKEDAQLKIDALQKRINQLQSELFHARNRAKRLANKTKNAV